MKITPIFHVDHIQRTKIMFACIVEERNVGDFGINLGILDEFLKM